MIDQSLDQDCGALLIVSLVFLHMRIM